MSAQTNSVSGVGSFKISGGLKAFFGICTLVGAAAFVFAVMKAPERAWPNFLINYFFFVSLALCGGFFTAIQHISNAYWSVTVRRLAEALMSYLPVALVLGVVLFFGRHHLYEWTHHEAVAEDHLLNLKAPYLNDKFFAIRMCVYMLIWVGLGFAMRRRSLLQDVDGSDKHTLSNIKLAALYLPLFGLSYTLFSFDLLMSLEPHWFSTIYGVYCFAGLFYSGLSLMGLLIIYGRKQGVFSEKVLNDNHLHDIGKLMFAFTVFWAYIMFSQLMLQWYANLPEEITYYLLRFNDGWWKVALALFFAHFIIPFFYLLPRETKRSSKRLQRIAFFMLASQWLDIYMLVMPVFFKGGPVFGWIEVGTFLGFLGLFGISVGRFLEKVPAIPVKDPRLSACLAHSQ